MTDTTTNQTAKNARSATKAAETITNDAAANAREFAELGLERAKAGYETFKDNAQEAVDVLDGSAAAFKTGSADFNAKAVEYAQANVNAGFEFARKAMGAKDVKELFALQTEFAQDQFKAYTRQMQDLGTRSAKLAEETSKPFAEGMKKSVEQVRRTFAV